MGVVDGRLRFSVMSHLVLQLVSKSNPVSGGVSFLRILEPTLSWGSPMPIDWSTVPGVLAFFLTCLVELMFPASLQDSWHVCLKHCIALIY